MHSISVTPEMVKKVITNLNSSKVCGPDCIPVVVLKNCEPELSYRPAELFSIFHKESSVSDYWTVSLVVYAIKNVGERSTAKNYHPVSFLSVVIKIFEKLVNNRIDCWSSREMWSFFWFPVWFLVFSFRSSDSCIW